MIKTVLYLLKIIIVVFLIFLTPFLIPLMFKLLMHFKLFNSIEEIKNIFNVLNNKYTLVEFVSDKNYTLEVQTMYKHKKRTLPLRIIPKRVFS